MALFSTPLKIKRASRNHRGLNRRRSGTHSNQKCLFLSDGYLELWVGLQFGDDSHDKLNQAKAFNYLIGAGYRNIRFVPRPLSEGSKRQTCKPTARSARSRRSTFQKLRPIAELAAAPEPARTGWTKASSENCHPIYGKRKRKWRLIVLAKAPNTSPTSSSISMTPCTNMPTHVRRKSTNTLRTIRCPDLR